MKLLQKFKKIWFYMFVLSIGLFLGQTFHCHAQYWNYDDGFFYGSEFEWNDLSDKDKTDIAQILKDDSINTKDNSLLYKIRQYFGLTWSDIYDQDTPATGYVTMIMNMLLWLTSFVSLILVIYAFYLMFFQKQEEWFAKAKKVLMGVAIALVIMWLSRVLVNFFFDLYSTELSKNL